MTNILVDLGKPIYFYFRVLSKKTHLGITTQKNTSVFKFLGVWVETLRLRFPSFSSFSGSFVIPPTISPLWDFWAWQVCLSKESFGWTLFPLWETRLLLLKTFNCRSIKLNWLITRGRLKDTHLISFISLFKKD